MTDGRTNVGQRVSTEQAASRTEPSVVDTTSESGGETDAAESQQNDDTVREIHVNGSWIQIDPGQTAGDLREETSISSGEVFTHRSDDGIQALSDDDVLAEHVEDGAQIYTQPLADSEVFGTA